MDVEALSLEAVRSGFEPFADHPEMIVALLQPEVAEVVGAKLVAQVTGELFVLLWP